MGKLPLALWITLGLFGAAHASAAAFTYHGTLHDGGRPADGKYDLELTLYSTANGGSALAGPLTMNAVPVQRGSFSTEVDFGPMSDVQGEAWLGVKVRPAGSSETFAALSARSPVSAAATTSVCPGAWTLQGNAGNPAGSYLGTADTQPLIFKVAGAQVAQFDTNQNFAINATAIDSATELTVAGSPSGGSFSNIFMRQHGVKSGIELSAGEATNDTANDAAFYLDQYDGGIGGADRKRRLAVLGNGALGINATTGILGDSPPFVDMVVGSRVGPGAGGTAIAMKTGSNSGTILDTEDDQSFAIIYYPSDGTSHRLFAANGGVGTTALNGASPTVIQPFLVGTTTANGNGAYLTPGGVWTSASSRTFKEAFARIDPGAILDKVIAMPIGTWRYKNDDAEGKHLGPVAEDFHAAFGLGNDERYIATIDEEGVALAAIQGLNERLRSQNDALRASLERLEQRLDAVEQHAH